MCPARPQTTTTVGRRLMATSGLLATAILAGCGAASEPSTGPTVAPLDAGGSYLLTGLELGGDSLPLGFTTSVDVDARFGSLSVATDCGVLLGSFSLEDDGRAGVTLAGGRTFDCSPGAAAQQQRLVDAFALIDTWAEDGDTLTFRGPDGERVVLSRA